MQHMQIHTTPACNYGCVWSTLSKSPLPFSSLVARATACRLQRYHPKAHEQLPQKDPTIWYPSQPTHPICVTSQRVPNYRRAGRRASARWVNHWLGAMSARTTLDGGAYMLYTTTLHGTVLAPGFFRAGGIYHGNLTKSKGTLSIPISGRKLSSLGPYAHLPWNPRGTHGHDPCQSTHISLLLRIPRTQARKPSGTFESTRDLKGCCIMVLMNSALSTYQASRITIFSRSPT